MRRPGTVGCHPSLKTRECAFRRRGPAGLAGTVGGWGCRATVPGMVSDASSLALPEATIDTESIRTDVRAAASTRRRRITAGWVLVVAAGGLISSMTFPGQTAGMSVFIDPLITDLEVSRTEIALSYLVGTLLGALAQPLIGRASDRWEIRYVMIGIALAFAAVLIGLSFVSDLFGLTAGYVGVRMMSQGALSLAVATAVARAVTHRRGLALGLFSALGTAGISLGPIAVERIIAAVGIYEAWRWEAVAVVALVIPAALLIRRRTASPVEGPERVEGWTRAEALRSGMFWVLTAALSTTSLLATALSFNQIAILGERGLTTAEAAANFLPQTITGLLGTILVGTLIDRWNPRVFTAASMASLLVAMAMVPFVEPGWSAFVYGLIVGIAIGMYRGMETASFARYFGVAHIGGIRGVATGVGLAAAALGPFTFALAAEWADGFAIPALVFTVFPAAVLVAALVVAEPVRRPRLRRI